jgi:hypothetical protein
MDRLEKMILFNLLIIVMILTSPLKQRQQCVALTVDGAQCKFTMQYTNDNIFIGLRNDARGSKEERIRNL